MTSILRITTVTCLIVSVTAGGGTAAVQLVVDSPGETLTENETATLWSKEPNNCNDTSVSLEGDADGSEAMQELSTCTDITFKEPPSTAARRTVSAFQQLEPGGTRTSRFPPDASLSDSWVIKDAHITPFAVHPSTRAHVDPDTSPLYIAPDGELRALVDYRVETPEEVREENFTRRWSVIDQEVTEVRLLRDGEEVATKSGTQTPVLGYSISGSGQTTLTLESDIHVEIREFEILRGDGWANTYTWDYSDDITVSQSLSVHVYDLSAERYTATYPNGDVGIGIYQSLPWHGYSLSVDDSDTVRGVWRYYTGRDTSWDQLVTKTADGSEIESSDARPVYVHSFPSRIGPRAEPDRGGPSILDIWGIESDSPAPRMHENVEVDVVNDTYTRSYGLVVRTDSVDPDALTVEGIVRGVETPLAEAEHTDDRDIRRSNIELEIEESTDSSAVLRVEVMDAKTGSPIVLGGYEDDATRSAPIGPEPREGYLTMGDERIETNRSGVATITVDEPGLYTVEYVPGPWYSHDPAYVGDSASVRWHPLTTVSGWLSLLSQAIWWFIPFGVSWYAGVRLSSYLSVGDGR